MLRIHVFPLLATRLIGQIDLAGIISVVCRMQEAGYSSGSINRVLAVLRRAFNLALKWRVCGVSGNPVSGLSVGPDILRSRFLSLEEAHRLIAALQADENRVAANAILLLLLTGARRNEITHAKWDDVNWGSKTLFVPVSKTGRPRMIALCRSAISLLQALAGRLASTSAASGPRTTNESAVVHLVSSGNPSTGFNPSRNNSWQPFRLGILPKPTVVIFPDIFMLQNLKNILHRAFPGRTMIPIREAAIISELGPTGSLSPTKCLHLVEADKRVVKRGSGYDPGCA